ncbi:hypothetical protein B4Q13_24845, partial [Lacticaseibacillus rhamnosus]
MFYPAHSQPRWAQVEAVSHQARLGQDVELAPGVVIAPGAEIGDGTRLDVLRAAGASEARLIAVCIDDREAASRIVDL